MRQLVIVFVASVLVSGCAMQYGHAPVPTTPSYADPGPWVGRPVLRMGMSVQINQNGVPVFVQCYDDCPSVTQKVLAHSVGQATSLSGGRALAEPTPPSAAASSPAAQVEVQARAHVEGGRGVARPHPPSGTGSDQNAEIEGGRGVEPPHSPSSAGSHHVADSSSTSPTSKRKERITGQGFSSDPIRVVMRVDEWADAWTKIPLRYQHFPAGIPVVFVMPKPLNKAQAFAMDSWQRVIYKRMSSSPEFEIATTPVVGAFNIRFVWNEWDA